jgi:2-polyprenyl-3-methyl-5-hydroxy-6-metoxy-1,4-benzoquinol methylase
MVGGAAMVLKPPHASARSESACPACGAQPTFDLIGPAAKYKPSFCPACGHGFIAAERLRGFELEGLYHHGYAGFSEDPVFAIACRKLTQEEILPRSRPHASLLDVGCGNGEFMRAAREAGLDAEGFDVSEAAAEFCRGRGLTARAGDFQQATFERKFDVITFWDVLEHLLEPVAALQKARSLLAPGGLLFTKTPGTAGLSLALTALVPRLGGALLAIPAHIQFFGADSMTRMLQTAGYREIEMLPPIRLRSQTSGGPLRKRLARRVVSTLQRLSGDGNLIVFARGD